MESSMKSQRPSGMMLNGVSAEENEYLAKEELVTIVSNMNRAEPFYFISGRFGPLEAGVECDVPIWLALPRHWHPFGLLLITFGSLLPPFGSFLIPWAPKKRSKNATSIFHGFWSPCW